MQLSNRGNHRLFFAIDFTPEFKQSINDWSLNLNINGRRVDKENYHITLWFLSSIANHRVFDIVDAIECPQIPPFPCKLGATQYWQKSEILFASITEGASELNLLRKNIHRQLTAITDLPKDKRKYEPHITLAREAKPPVDFPAPQNLSTRVTSFCLMESIPVKSGVYYQTVESWPIYHTSVKERLLGKT